MQRLTSSSENQNEYGAVARDLLGTISHRILGTFLRHISLVAHLLTRKLPTTHSACALSEVCPGNDLSFVQRLVIQCMLPGAANDLSVEAQSLTNKVTTLFPPAAHDGISSGLHEPCPACGVEVPLTDIATAACSNGHKWRESLMTSDMAPS